MSERSRRPTDLIGRTRARSGAVGWYNGPVTQDRWTELRRSYATTGLDEADLAADPTTQLLAWFDDAVAADLPEPNAIVVATADANGRPAVRYVLLKGLDERGLVFYTNYGSAKAAELDANPVASVLFPWHALQRQVRVTGPVSKVDPEQSEAYFTSRPYGSQIGAWASRQSAPAGSRSELDAAYEELAERFPDGAPVPLPEFWGGYRVAIDTAEFWQGRVNRLHDRLRYRRNDRGDGWLVERLWP
jgi:pyridoxamine 5'-phosphate oxidase